MDFGNNANPWLSELAALSQQAGKAILAHYGDTESARLDDKSDGSPLTAADLASHETIVAGLHRIAPDILIISEENKDNPPLAAGTPFWLVDPLDGTKEFIKRNGEFTVNIALMRNDKPVLAVVHAPVLDTTYVGEVGIGAWRIKHGAAPESIRVAKVEGELRVVASRSHRDEKTDALLAKLLPSQVVSAGSSLKFCLVAEGSADFYPRLGPTMEWDTAAAQCVLEAAGGRVVQCDGSPMQYNKQNRLNPFFFAIGSMLPVYDEIMAGYRNA